MRVFERGNCWGFIGWTRVSVTWPVGRPRALGFELFNLGLSGMLRAANLQLSWGFRRTPRYCYIGNRQLTRLRYLIGGGRG